MDSRGVWASGIAAIRHCGKWFIYHLDARGSIFGEVTGFCNDDGNRIADVTDLIAHQDEGSYIFP
jgi:hypothetical protein